MEVAGHLELLELSEDLTSLKHVCVFMFYNIIIFLFFVHYALENVRLVVIF